LSTDTESTKKTTQVTSLEERLERIEQAIRELIAIVKLTLPDPKR